VRQLDEPIHFAAAALMAGFRHVIGTLWPLRDDAEPADVIYGVLAQTQPLDYTASQAAIATHTAIHQQRSIKGHRAFHWATHIHYGP
jgi:CHAT domain-containing protein